MQTYSTVVGVCSLIFSVNCSLTYIWLINDQSILVLNVIPQLYDSPEESSDEAQLPVPAARTKSPYRLVVSVVAQGKIKSHVLCMCSQLVLKHRKAITTLL